MVKCAIGVPLILALAACDAGTANTAEPTAVHMPSAATPTQVASGDSCQPPNIEAAVTGHWPEPSGC